MTDLADGRYVDEQYQPLRAARLRSSLASRDPNDALLAVAKRMRTGTVSVNGAPWFAADTPFGGYKQSGVGREFGVEGFEGYLETKSVGLPV